MAKSDFSSNFAPIIPIDLNTIVVYGVIKVMFNLASKEGDMKAVFIDRDGTIARDVHYCRRVEDFEILPTVPEAIRLLNQHGFKVVIITNQSGIARGYFNETTLLQIHQHMRQELAKYDARVDAIYYCPHHPEEGCECRKPKPGLILKAAQDLAINLGRSFMVGDGEMDIRAGKAAGCRTILVATEPDIEKETTDPPDYIADNMLRAAQWIIDKASPI